MFQKRSELVFRKPGEEFLFRHLPGWAVPSHRGVIEAIKERLKTLKEEVPADIELHTVLDNSGHIYAMINNLVEAAVVAGILVIVVCILSLRRFRSSLIVTLAIPFSLIGAFIALCNYSGKPTMEAQLTGE